MTSCRVFFRSSAFFFFLAIAATHVPACEYGQDASAVSVSLRPLPTQTRPAPVTLDATLRTTGTDDARVG
jgi:hypothetical protein